MAESYRHSVTGERERRVGCGCMARELDPAHEKLPFEELCAALKARFLIEGAVLDIPDEAASWSQQDLSIFIQTGGQLRPPPSK